MNSVENEINWQQDLPQSLNAAAMQCAQRLGLYQAEMASILGVTCVEVGQMNRHQFMFAKGTKIEANAIAMIQMFNALFVFCKGSEVMMFNWIRRQQPPWPHTPLIEMVDYSGVDNVLNELLEAVNKMTPKAKL